MPSATLVPVDHEPNFGGVSLVPVDHAPDFGPTLVPVEHNPFDYSGVGAAMPESYGANVPIRDPLANAVASVATLPKRAIDASAADLATMGSGDPMQSIGPALEAAMLPMGTGAIAGVPIKAGEAVLGSGVVRKLPTDNYLGPISKHTDTLYREMHPSEALESLPGSVSYGGSGPGGVARKYYADDPDLATGQGSNRGVRVQYDAAPFEGTINKQKPAWDLAFQNGSGEYLAAPRPGTSIRDAVRSFEIDPSTLSRVETAQYQRVLSNLKDKGWSVDKSGGKIVASAPRSPSN